MVIYGRFSCHGNEEVFIPYNPSTLDNRRPFLQGTMNSEWARKTSNGNNKNDSPAAVIRCHFQDFPGCLILHPGGLL